MSIKVVMVVNPAVMVKDMPDNVRAVGAEVTVNTTAKTEEELLSLCSDADFVMTHTNYFPFTPRVLRGLPKCRFLFALSVGSDAIDVTEATKNNIGVITLKGFCPEELAEHAMALMLGCARYIVIQNSRVKAGKQALRQNDKEGRFLTILKGKTLGIIGLGSAGTALVPLAKGFNMNILAYDPFLDGSEFEKQNVKQVQLDTLMRESDYVAILASLNQTNVHMIGLEQLKSMKPTAFIVNTARGSIIDEPALITALSEGYIAGAGLDVNDPEPILPDNPLLKMENVILTGHRASSSRESGIVMGRRPAEELTRIMHEEWPIGLINPEVKDRLLAKWGKLRVD
jgi:D-3-phosphoglycerate dehydrogenase / 2-oxoglutarate reductase